jgi:hypothetical protein
MTYFFRELSLSSLDSSLDDNLFRLWFLPRDEEGAFRFLEAMARLDGLARAGGFRETTVSLSVSLS